MLFCFCVNHIVMLRYTTTFKGQTKRLQLDPQHRAMADLLILGWNARDAYLAMNLYNASFSDEYHLSKIEEITGNDAFKLYIQKKQRALKRGFKSTVPSSVGSDEEESTEGKYRTKDEILNGLIEELPNLRGKDKADVLMKIADLQRMKQDEVVNEDNTVHFYVPISCHNCSLYIQEKKRLQRKRNLNSEGEN